MTSYSMQKISRSRHYIFFPSGALRFSLRNSFPIKINELSGHICGRKGTCLYNFIEFRTYSTHPTKQELYRSIHKKFWVMQYDFGLQIIISSESKLLNLTGAQKFYIYQYPRENSKGSFDPLRSLS